METFIDEEDNEPLTIKDFVDFLNKEENEPLRFLLGLELYYRQAYIIQTERKEETDESSN